jgi:hypothetical protein
MGHPTGKNIHGCRRYCLSTRPRQVVKRFFKEKIVTKRHQTKLVHEGHYAAEVDIEIIDANDGWSPYISLDDARKLDGVREALRRNDVKSASKIARVFTLTPV